MAKNSGFLNSGAWLLCLAEFVHCRSNSHTNYVATDFSAPDGKAAVATPYVYSDSSGDTLRPSDSQG